MIDRSIDLERGARGKKILLATGALDVGFGGRGSLPVSGVALAKMPSLCLDFLVKI